MNTKEQELQELPGTPALNQSTLFPETKSMKRNISEGGRVGE